MNHKKGIQITAVEFVDSIFSRAIDLSSSFFIIVRNTNGLCVTYFGGDSDSTRVTVDPMNTPTGHACFVYIKQVFNLVDSHKVFPQQNETKHPVKNQHYRVRVSVTPAKVVGHEFITITFLD